MEIQSFKEYCQSKSIDPGAFFKAEPDKFNQWKAEYDQMSPKSFTQQKLFLINDIRRKYHYEAPPEAKKPEAKAAPKIVMKPAGAKPAAKPVIKPKIKSEGEQTAKPKPVIKPKITPKKPSSDSSETTEQPKKPQIKIKIPPRKKED